MKFPNKPTILSGSPYSQMQAFAKADCKSNSSTLASLPTQLVTSDHINS